MIVLIISKIFVIIGQLKSFVGKLIYWKNKRIHSTEHTKSNPIKIRNEIYGIGFYHSA